MKIYTCSKLNKPIVWKRGNEEHSSAQGLSCLTQNKACTLHSHTSLHLHVWFETISVGFNQWIKWKMLIKACKFICENTLGVPHLPFPMKTKFLCDFWCVWTGIPPQDKLITFRNCYGRGCLVEPRAGKDTVQVAVCTSTRAAPFSFLCCQVKVTALFSPLFFSLFSVPPFPCGIFRAFYLSFGIFPWELNMLLSLFWNQLTSAEFQSLVFQFQSPAGQPITFIHK